MDEETDELILATQSMCDGQNMAIAAIALALIDKGAIDRVRLFDIIESLHGILAADYVGALGDIGDAEVGLSRLRAWLDASDWKEGKVVEELHKLEGAEFLRSQLKLANSKRRKPPPKQGTD
ncbi:conserved protein of unknown function [Shinella sp. WSC3-e]|nr:conserved protein of unknown function [Shinella sp. WSC3-e]